METEEEELIEAEGVQVGVGDTGRGKVRLKIMNLGMKEEMKEEKIHVDKVHEKENFRIERLVPQFQPLIHSGSRHDQQAHYPEGFDVNAGTLVFFELFF